MDHATVRTLIAQERLSHHGHPPPGIVITGDQYLDAVHGDGVPTDLPVIIRGTNEACPVGWLDLRGIA